MIALARLKPYLALCPLAAVLFLASCTSDKVAPAPTTAQAQKTLNANNGRPIARQPQATVVPATIGGPRKVALLLPLSGAQGAVGQSLMNAAMLAVQELAPANLEVSVEDTAQTGGVQAAFNAARGQGAQLVIGPLFSSDVQAIKGEAAISGIPILALSNDTDLAGQNTYIAGFWPGAQIARVLLYAQKRGYHNIAMLLPDDAYGRKVEAAVNSTLQPPSRLITLGRYHASDYTPAVMQLAQVRGQYDALLVPAAGDQLFGLLQALQQQDLLKGAGGKPVQLLGSGQWDEPETQRRPELAGAWYAAPEPENWQAFAARYQRAFGAPPLRIASLAYDTTALAAVLASRNWPYNAQAITQKQGFAGVDGLFRMQGNGLVERGLAVLQLSPSGATVADPAPKQF